MNIVLIGYRGTGKTVVGKILAEKLNMKLFGMDEHIAEKAGYSIPDIVAEEGWDRFRDLESEVAEEASGQVNSIIDTGGGVVLRASNIEHLKKAGILFWLKADAQNISDRIKDSTERPSLTENKTFLEEVEEVLEERTPQYMASADYAIDTNGLTEEQVAENIISIITEKK